MSLLRRLLVEEEAQDLVEYTLMIGFVVTAIWLAVKVDALGIPSSLSTIWSRVDETVGSAPGAAS